MDPEEGVRALLERLSLPSAESALEQQRLQQVQEGIQ